MDHADTTLTVLAFLVLVLCPETLCFQVLLQSVDQTMMIVAASSSSELLDQRLQFIQL